MRVRHGMHMYNYDFLIQIFYGNGSDDGVLFDVITDLFAKLPIQ